MSEALKAPICLGIPCLLTGGTEIQTLNLAHALVSEGYRVVLVCYFEYSEEMVARYQQAGVKVVCLGGERPVATWQTVLFLLKGLRRVVKQYRPQIAHVQYMAPGMIPIVLLKLLGVKHIIATSHTAADIYPSLKGIHLLQRHVLSAFNCITQLAEASYFNQSTLFSEQYPWKRRNHFTIHNALPISLSPPEIFPERPARSTVHIGAVSRMEHIKGMDLLVEAFALLYQKAPFARLQMVGDGSLLPALQQRAVQLGIAEAITWHGRQPQEQLSAFYQDFDLLAMPSRSEGFGLTAIEAMAYGCPVVAARTGGLPEVVKEGVVGLLHTSEDIPALAEALWVLAQNADQRQRYAQAAFQEAQRYRFAHYQQQIAQMYQKIAQA